MAIDIIPKTLAENAGPDSMNMLAELRSRHEQGNKDADLDVYSGRVVDMAAGGIIEAFAGGHLLRRRGVSA